MTQWAFRSVRRLGPYEIVARLGAAGMGEVARATGLAAAGGVLRDPPVSSSGESLIDVAPDGSLAYVNSKSEIETFDPASQHVKTFAAPPGLDSSSLRWLPHGHAMSYIVLPRAQDDPNGGLWLRREGEEPRQLFRGWLTFQVVAGDETHPDRRRIALQTLEWNEAHHRTARTWCTQGRTVCTFDRFPNSMPPRSPEPNRGP